MSKKGPAGLKLSISSIDAVLDLFVPVGRGDSYRIIFLSGASRIFIFLLMMLRRIVVNLKDPKMDHWLNIWSAGAMFSFRQGL